MTLDRLIKELEKARRSWGGDSEVRIEDGTGREGIDVYGRKRDDGSTETGVSVVVKLEAK